MKVLLVNGSPHPKGTTFRALTEVATALESQGIETEIFNVGAKAIVGCIGCMYCRTHEGCVAQDTVNECREKLDSADGFIFGTSVHYAAPTGAITSFMDRLFFSSGSKMAYKPGAAIVVARRGGTSAAFDQLNKYFTINNMPVVSSCYWNSVHGMNGDEAEQDLEGMYVMKNLGINMAWLLKSIDAGKKAGIETPNPGAKPITNFIR